MKVNSGLFSSNLKYKRVFLLFFLLNLSILGFSQLSLPRTVALKITNTAYNSFAYDFCGITPNPCDIYWKPTVYDQSVGGSVIGSSFFGFDGNCNHDCAFFNTPGSSSFIQNYTLYNTTATCASSIYMDVENWEDEFCIFAPNNDGVYDAGCDVLHYISARQSINILTNGSGTIHNGGIAGDGTPGYDITWAVTVTNATNPVLVLNNSLSTTSVCAGQNAIFAFTGASSGSPNYRVYSNSSRTTLLTSGTGSSVSLTPANDPRLNTPGNVFTVYVTEQLTTTCETPATPVTITVLSGSNPPTVTSPVSTCLNGQAQLSVSSADAGAIFNWYSGPSGGSSIWTGSTYLTPQIGASTTFYVTATNPALGCESVRVPIVVNPDLSISTPSASATVACQGSTSTLTASGTGGGAFYWYADAALNNLTFIGNPFTTPALNANKSYWVVEDINGCRSSSSKVDITVNPKPNAGNILETVVCQGSSLIPLSITPPAGFNVNWYYDGKLFFAQTNNIIWGPIVNDHEELYYTLVSPEGCESDFAPYFINVYPAIEDPNVDNLSLCTNEAGIITATAVEGNIVWYDEDGISVIETDLGNIGELPIGPFASTGNHIYFVQADNGTCQSGLVPVVVYVNDGVSGNRITVSGAESCEGRTATLVASNGTSGGTFNWYSDKALTQLLFIGNPYTTAPLSGNTSYWIAESAGSCGAGTSTQVDVLVNPKPSAGVSLETVVCQGSSLIPLSVTPPAGLNVNWYYDGKLFFNQSNSIIWGPIVNDHEEMYYTFVSAEGCESDFAPYFINVYPAIEEPNVDNLSLCINQAGIITATAVEGNIVWYDEDGTTIIETDLGNIGQLTIDAYAVTGDHTFYVQADNGTCKSGLLPVVVSVTDGISGAAPIAQGTTICQGETSMLMANNVTGGGVFSWYADAALTQLLFVGNPYLTKPLDAPTTFWVVETSGSCASSVATEVIVNVNLKPNAPNSTYKYFCPSETEILEPSPSVPTGLIAEWYSSPHPSGYIASGNTFAIQSVYSRRTVYYRFINDTTGCASEFAAWDVYVNPEVEEPNVDNLSLCVNQAGVITATAVEGNIVWYDEDGTTVLETDLGNIGQLSVAAYAVTGSHTFYVQADNGTCKSGLVPVVVYVSNGISGLAPIAENKEICAGTTAVLSATNATNGGTFNWYADAALTQLLFIGSPYTTQPLTTNTTYYVTESAGTCGSSIATEVIVTVNPKPQRPTAFPESICFGERATLEAFGSGGEIKWYSDPLGIDYWATGNEFTTPTLSQYTPYYFFETDLNTGCKSDVAVTWVNVDNFTYVSSATVLDNPICTGEKTIIKVASTDLFSCIQLYNWNLDLIDEICLPDGGISNSDAEWVANFEVGPFDEAGDYIFYVQESDGIFNCPSQQISAIVTVVDKPLAPVITGDRTYCLGETVLLLADDFGDGEIVWYRDKNLTRELFIGKNLFFALTDDQTFYVTRRTATCQSEPTRVDVTINPLPATPTATTDFVCFGERATFEAQGSGGLISWYSDPLGVDFWTTGNEFTTPPLSQYTPYYLIEENLETGCKSKPGVTYAFVDNFTYVSSATVLDNPICVGATTKIKVATTDIYSCVQLLDFNLNVIDEICLPDGEPSNSDAEWVANFEVGPFDEAGDYIFYVQEGDGFLFCPSQQFSLVVTVLDRPATPIITGDTAVCEGEQISLSADDNGDGVIVWFADQNLTRELFIGNTFTSNLEHSRTFYVVRRTQDCQSEAAQVNVTINPKPATPVVPPKTICAATTAILEVEDTENGGIVYWYSDPSGVNLLGTGNIFETPSLNQYTPYYVIRVDSITGCKSEVGVTHVSVDNFTYVSSATVLNNPICIGATTKIKVATTDLFSCVQLLDFNLNVVDEICLPDGESTGSDAEWVATFEVGPFDEAGDYIYYVQEGNGIFLCPSQQFSLVVTVLDKLATPIITGDTAICEGGQIKLKADDNGDGVIVWFADEDLTRELFIGNTFETSIDHSRTFYVVRRTQDCQSKPAQVSVTVNPKPATPVVPPTFTCAGSSAFLEVEDTENGGIVYWYSDPLGADLWEVGDEFITPPLYQYTPYYVFRVDPITGCKSDVGVTYVFVDNFTYVSSATVVDNPVCTGETAIIKVATTDIFSCVQLYNWNLELVDEICLPDEDPDQTDQPWVADFEVGPFDEAGEYIFYVQESDGLLFCPSQQLSVLIIVKDGPEAPEVSNDGPACEGEDVMVNASTVAGATYLWNGPNGFSTTEQNFILSNVTIEDAGDYYVTVKVGNCTSQSSVTTVEVYPIPSVEGEITSNSPLCEGENLKLGVSAVNPLNVIFEWTGPNGFTSNLQNPTIENVNEVDNQGFYSVVLIDTVTGCSSNPKSTLVSISRAPTGISATNSGAACEGENIKLSASYVYGATYEWSGPNAFSSTDRNPILENVVVAQSGTYTVIVSIGNCESEGVSTEVVVYPTPIAYAGEDITIIQGSSVQLNGSGGITYTWSPAEFLDHPNLPNPVATPPIGEHIYTLTVTNEYGCSGSDEVKITVLPNLVPETVNLITPNGDGINDYFTVGYLENLESYTLSIYARGGVKIFETDAYANDWNGTFKGKDLPDGTYWYVIRSEGKEFKGAITIKR